MKQNTLQLGLSLWASTKRI